MSSEITNTQDIIDSRDIIERIDELQDENDSLVEAYRDAEDDQERSDALDALYNFGYCIHADGLVEAIQDNDDLSYWMESDEAGELRILLKVQEHAEGYAPDWKYGEALISKDYFTDYCQQLCEDLGYISKDFPGFIEIDWEATAENIKMDYSEIDFDGESYFIRS